MKTWPLAALLLAVETFLMSGGLLAWAYASLRRSYGVPRGAVRFTGRGVLLGCVLALWPAVAAWSVLGVVNGCLQPADRSLGWLNTAQTVTLFVPWAVLVVVLLYSFWRNRLMTRAAPVVVIGLSLLLLVAGSSCSAALVNGWLVDQPRCL